MIPQFTGAAYQSWAFKLQFGLVEKDLHTVVCDFKGRARKPCPAVIGRLTQGELLLLPAGVRTATEQDRDADIDVRDAEIESWMDKDLKAQAFIVRYLGASEQTHVRNCDFAYQMWDALKTFYSLQGEIEIANAQAQLSAIVQSESEDLTVFVRRLQEIHGLLDRLGEPIPSSKQATNLLNSLNTKYSPMVKNIQTWSLTSPQLYNIQTILSTLLQEDVREEINARKRGEPLADHHGAPSANYGGSGPSGRPYSGSGGAGTWGDRKCHACGKTGHLKKDCKGESIQKCHNCGKPGHYKAQCRSDGGGDSRGRGMKTRYEGGKVCLHCGMKGHVIDQCTIKMRGDKARANLAMAEDYIDPSQFASYTVMTEPNAFSVANTKVSLILDSGASANIVPDKASFESYNTDIPLSSSFIYTADNKPHEIKGQGVVNLRLHQGTESTIVKIQALHVPSLGQHLISLGCINETSGVEFYLSKNGVPTLTREGKTWSDVKKTHNGLMLLSGHVLPPALCDVALKGQALTVGMDWHLRMGHPGIPMMHELSTKGKIPRLISADLEEVKSCEICIAAKLSQSPHKSISESTLNCTEKLDRIHMDLVGPISVVSHHGGFRYFQSCIEVSTRLSVVSLLKNKSEALTVSRVVIAQLESESGKRLKTLRTDGGGEYNSTEWRAFATIPGHEFDHQFTAPYSPQQNGMCERLNRTLLEKMRCLMIWSELPKSYWDVALLHANWIRNRSPTSGLKGNLPIEAWTGRESKMRDVHTFGCLVQYLKVGHDKERSSNKFASKTAYGIFLGMAQGQAGFSIFDPLRANLVIRTDVKFHDSVPGYPRLVGKNSPVTRPPTDADFFTLFPSSDDEPTQPAVPAIPTHSHVPAATGDLDVSPIHVIPLSSDSESGVRTQEDNNEEEVDGRAGHENESIAHRVTARRRAHFVGLNELL